MNRSSFDGSLSKFDISISHRISSDNNSRKYNGTTFIEDAGSPSVQRFTLDDGSRHSIYEVVFTGHELRSDQTFCRGISKIISGQYTSQFVIQIDPNALKSLIG